MKILFAIIKYTALIFSLMMVGAISTFITLQFFTSGDEATVPDLKGKDAMEAIQLLNRQGLQLKILPQKRYSDQVGADRVVAQKPDPRSKIKRGRSVEVYLSLGPEKAIVPDLVGETARVANMTLEQRGLHEGKLIYVPYPNAEGDQILAQYPLPGTELTGTRTVNLLVNNGVGYAAVYVMPDLIGKQVSEVETYLNASGLKLGASQPIAYPGIAPGTVVKQTPASGYKVTKDSYIGLYYAQ